MNSNSKIESILNTSFLMKDYIEVKAFLIGNAYENNNHLGISYLKEEILFLIAGSTPCYPVMESAASCLLLKIENKELAEYGRIFMHGKCIDFYLAEVKKNGPIKIISANKSKYKDGSKFFINAEVIDEFNSLVHIEISEDNIHFIGLNNFINLEKVFSSYFLELGVLAIEDL